jgi:hypothetical protein
MLEREGFKAGRSGAKKKLVKTKDKKRRSGDLVRRENGVYWSARQSLSKRFSKVVKIAFEWFPAYAQTQGASFLFPATSRRGKKLRYNFAGAEAGGRYKQARKHKKTGKYGPYVFPSVVIYVGDEGIK